MRLSFFVSLFCVGFLLAARKIVIDYGKNPHTIIKKIILDFNKDIWEFCLTLWLISIFTFVLRAPDMYSHYLLLAILPATFFAGKVAADIFHSLKKRKHFLSDLNIFETAVIVIIVFLSVMNFGDYVDKPILSEHSPNTEIADYIKRNTNSSDCIYTFRGPQIYIYSDREPASKYFILLQGYSPVDYIPEEIRNDIERNRPKYIITDNHIPAKYNQTLNYIYQHYHHEITIDDMDLYRINEERAF